MLTETQVRNAKSSLKPVRLFDGGGMYLEIAPNGGKWWRLKYRHLGKEKRMSLGVYPDVGLKIARERRNEARKLLTDGVDPSENRKAIRATQVERNGNSFEVVAREWFAKYAPSWAACHSSRIIRRFEKDSSRSYKRPMSDNAILAAMRRMGISKEEMSGHGFRAMARTILDEVLAVRPDLIEHQLAHAVRDPNGRAYNRTAHLSERKKMMQLWADYLDELKKGAEIIQLNTALKSTHYTA